VRLGRQVAFDSSQMGRQVGIAQRCAVPTPEHGTQVGYE